MGRLVDLSEFQNVLDPRWYFVDADRDYRSQRWVFDVSKTYPHACTIHLSRLAPPLMIRVREWIEETLSGAIITEYRNMNYRYLANPAARFFDRYTLEVSHGYQYFYFKTSSEKALFILAFSEYLDDVSDACPGHPPPSNAYGDLTDHLGRPIGEKVPDLAD